MRLGTCRLTVVCALSLVGVKDSSSPPRPARREEQISSSERAGHILLHLPPSSSPLFRSLQYGSSLVAEQKSCPLGKLRPRLHTQPICPRINLCLEPPRCRRAGDTRASRSCSAWSPPRRAIYLDSPRSPLRESGSQTDIAVGYYGLRAIGRRSTTSFVSASREIRRTTSRGAHTEVGAITHTSLVCARCTFLK